MSRRRGTVLLSAALVLAAAAMAGASGVDAAERSLCGESLVHSIPARPAQAPGGTQFADSIEHLDGADREALISRELLAGNVPTFLRHLVPIRLSGRAASGRLTHIVLCALPDYLAVGSDVDFLYVPMRLTTALQVAQHFGFILPTPRIVDAIYAQAAARFIPQPLPANDAMRSTDYYRSHNALIAEQRSALGLLPGDLTAGEKKDLVLTNRLWRFPDRVAIYGWQIAAGHPIQPLSTLHGWRYTDYSHGARLISTRVWVDGLPRSMIDVLQDPRLAGLLSREGIIPNVAALIEQLSHAHPTHSAG